jgi:hypothetical protein
MKVEEDRISRAWWGGWVLLRSVLLESGIALAGPAPAALIHPVPPEELKQANLATLHGWFAAFLEDPAELADSGYQAYAVLTLCRILYTQECGVITSKQTAAQWAQERLGDPWVDLIERTWAGRRNPNAQASPEDIKATQDFIRYTLEKCK